jgi:hypothetical protein
MVTKCHPGEAMVKNISIREVRASKLRELAAEGTLAAITDNRVLAGIFCPVTQDWLTQMLAMNRSRIRESVRSGEKELANLAQLRTLDSLAAETATAPVDPAPVDTSAVGWNPIEAVQDVLSAVRHAMSPSHDAAGPAKLETKTVRIGELSGPVIREAARTGQTLAVTDRRELVGVIIPVDERLVAHIVEENLSRIYRNVLEGERELRTEATQTLDDL